MKIRIDPPLAALLCQPSRAGCNDAAESKTGWRDETGLFDYEAMKGREYNDGSRLILLFRTSVVLVIPTRGFEGMPFEAGASQLR